MVEERPTIYVMEMCAPASTSEVEMPTFQHIKIGITLNPSTRKEAFMTGTPYLPRYRHLFFFNWSQFPTLKELRKLEQGFYEYLERIGWGQLRANYGGGTEWFHDRVPDPNGGFMYPNYWILLSSYFKQLTPVVKFLPLDFDPYPSTHVVRKAFIEKRRTPSNNFEYSSLVNISDTVIEFISPSKVGCSFKSNNSSTQTILGGDWLPKFMIRTLPVVSLIKASSHSMIQPVRQIPQPPLNQWLSRHSPTENVSSFVPTSKVITIVSAAEAASIIERMNATSIASTSKVVPTVKVVSIISTEKVDPIVLTVNVVSIVSTTKIVPISLIPKVIPTVLTEEVILTPDALPSTSISKLNRARKQITPKRGKKGNSKKPRTNSISTTKRKNETSISLRVENNVIPSLTEKSTRSSYPLSQWSCNEDITKAFNAIALKLTELMFPLRIRIDEPLDIIQRMILSYTQLNFNKKYIHRSMYIFKIIIHLQNG